MSQLNSGSQPPAPNAVQPGLTLSSTKSKSKTYRIHNRPIKSIPPDPGFVPMPYDPANPLPPIMPMPNPPNFSEEEEIDDSNVDLAIGCKLFVCRENKEPFDWANMDLKVSLEAIELMVKTAKRQKYEFFPGMSNSGALFIIKWNKSARNNPSHYNLRVINQNLHGLMSTKAILAGPKMINYPPAYKRAMTDLTSHHLAPIPISAMPSVPIV